MYFVRRTNKQTVLLNSPRLVAIPNIVVAQEKNKQKKIRNCSLTNSNNITLAKNDQVKIGCK